MANNLHGSGGNRNGRLRRTWKETILTCDGGGIRGYASLLMICKLMELVSVEEQRADALLRQSKNITSYDHANDPLRSSPPLPCHYFDYIVGTSTGGLIAIMLGRLRMNVKHCLVEYRRLGDRVFCKKRLFHYYRYDHRILEDSITDVVMRYCHDGTSEKDGKDMMYQHDADDTACRTAILATEKCEGEKDRIHPFTSYRRWQDEETLSPVSPRNPRSVYIYKAARATSAAPGFFQEQVVLGSRYMDGAILENNPSRWAWTEAWANHPKRRFVANEGVDNEGGSAQTQQGQDRSPCRIGVFVSMGTGLRAPLGAFHPGDPLGKLRKLLRKAVGTLTDTEEVHEDLRRRAAEHGNRLYYRFNPEGLEKMRIAECKRRGKTFQTMESAVQSYLQRNDVRNRIDECARELVQHRRSRLTEEELLEFHDLTRPGPRAW